MKKILFIASLCLLYVVLPAATIPANTNAGIKSSIRFPYQTLYIDNNGNASVVYVTIDGVGYTVAANSSESFSNFILGSGTHSVSIQCPDNYAYGFTDNLGNSGSNYAGQQINYTINGTVNYYRIDILNA